MLFFPNMYQRGVKYISHIVRNGELIDYDTLREQYPGVTISAFTYQCLKHAIPREWKSILRASRTATCRPRNFETELLLPVGDVEVDLVSATSKHFYLNLIQGSAIPTCRQRWEAEHFIFSENRWREIYRLPYEVTTSTKLQTLQYKVINRYVTTRKYLYNCKIIESPICLYCTQVDNLHHFLYGCEQTRIFWNEVIEELKRIFHARLRLGSELIIFGLRRVGSLSNYLILLGKQFIVNRKLKEETISTEVFWRSVKHQYKVDECIAAKSGMDMKRFHRKWRGVTDFLSMR